MDLFKFHTPDGDNEDTHLVNGGEYINGLLTKEWIDRYRDAGSFSLTSKASSGIRDLLPEGTLIGLRGNKSIMMVEDHHLADEGSAIIRTTGRSLEAFLENRIVRWGLNEDGEYVFDSPNPWLSWDQAHSLIYHQIISTSTSSDRIRHLEVLKDVQRTTTGATREQRKVPRGQLYSAVKTILDLDDIGWRIIRPGPWSPADDPENNIVLVLHSGVDRRSEITMSFESGDILSADYLWSIKNYNNCALAYSKWGVVQPVGDYLSVGLKRRLLYVDAGDVDEAQPDPDETTWDPTKSAYISAAVKSRGKEELAKRKKIALSSVTPSPNARTHVYGRDYDIGDIVTARGNYTESRPMRISEYVYVEDANGEFGYPTLEVLEEETE
jgi:hypothetical protein